MMMVTLKDGGAGSLCESPPPVKISFLHSSTNSFETAEEVAHPPTPHPFQDPWSTKEKLDHRMNTTSAAIH